jgi:hypothetical protein
MSVCDKCIEDKARYQDSTLPCSKFEDLWASGKFKTAKEILCRVGPYHWCPRFCNLPDRILEIKVHRELPDIVNKVKYKWVYKKLFPDHIDT